MFREAVSVLIIGLLASVATLFIQTGTDDSETAAIGVQKKWGFPIVYRTTASGLAWADFNGHRFVLNTVAWVVVVGAIWAGTRRWNAARRRTSGSEPASD